MKISAFLAALVAAGCADAAPEAASPIVGSSASYGEDINNTKVQFPGQLVPAKIIPLPYTDVLFWTEPPPPGLLSTPLYSSEVAAALHTWEEALTVAGVGTARIRFRPGSSAGGSHIVIGFRPSNHSTSCDAGFTSAETLAHAFTYGNGCLAGTIHLNQDLPWVLNGRDEDGTFDLRTVLIHEIGHVLGLAHVFDRPDDVMYASYEGLAHEISVSTAQKLLAGRQDVLP